MRMLWLGVVVAACDGASSARSPPDTVPQQPADCAHVCQVDEGDCYSFSYEDLPVRCHEICSLGRCCSYDSGKWTTTAVDCARPRPDAGADTGS